MFSLSDTLPMQSYPSKVGLWFRLVWPYRSLRGTTYSFSTDLFSCMKSVVYYGWHFADADFVSCRMFILIAECGLVRRSDRINCETCHFCFDPAFVWLSLGRADFHSA